MPTKVRSANGLRVGGYNHGTLEKFLAAGLRHQDQAINGKTHVKYLKDYLDHFANDGPITLALESEYVDHDFMEDYAAYYVRCYPGRYQSVCSRLHFFRERLSGKDLSDAALGTSKRWNQDSLSRIYLGFIVLKPLPQTYIGRSCLRPYEEVDGRLYPAVRTYHVHLLGMDLQVPSLAFQEQDTVAAACATSALWSAFQSTGVVFHHHIASPVEITRHATESGGGSERAFPNRGLNALQLAGAIRKAGLEPELIGVSGEEILQATAYAYLRARIPLLLMVLLYDVSDPDKPVQLGGDDGAHAVTITGFRLGRKKPVPLNGVLLRSSRMDKLYVHDDQVGPFARLSFDNYMPPRKAAEKLPPFTLASSWPTDGGVVGAVRFAPYLAIAPLYHKVRLNSQCILEEVLRENKLVASALPGGGVEWDIFLSTEFDLKRDIREHTGLDQGEKMRVLSAPMPRFLWRAIVSQQEVRILEFIYDATDIEQGNFLRDIVFYM